MLSDIKNIIFDIGGVMIRLDRDRCVASFTAIGFPDADRLIDLYHPADFFNRLERGEMSAAEFYQTIRDMSGRDISDEAIQEAYGDFLVEIPLHKLQLLGQLRERGYRIYALSNINEVVLPKVLSLFEADGKSADYYFDKMYLSFEMQSLKPDHKIYEMLMTDSGVVPAETLFIDDSERNILSGSQLGFNVYLADPTEDYSHLFI